MPDILSILTSGRGDDESCRHGIPHRVSMSLQFVGLMRQTAVRPAYEGGPASEAPQNRAEAAAYTAALDCLRTYFNGENFTGEPRGPGPAPDDREPPPAAGPVASPVPAGRS